METLLLSLRNIFRNPLRLLLIVLLLGVSLMLVAAMVSLNGSAQQELKDVQKQIGTAITITYTANDAQSVKASGTGHFQNTPLPNSAVTMVQHVAGVSSVEENLSRTDTESALVTNTIQLPNGKSFTPPPIVNGFSPGATHFTLQGGATPTLTAGRGFQARDANTNVAMMSEQLARANSLAVGSTFDLRGTIVTLIGLYTTDQLFAQNSLVVPMATMQRLFGVDGVDSITAYAQSYAQVNGVAARLHQALGQAYNVVPEASDFTTTMDALMAVQNSITLALSIAILTATLVIIFTVVLMVREKNREIAILKALGASHWQVIRQFWGEVLALSTLAALIAVILLVMLGPIISQVFTVAPGTDSNSGGVGNSPMFASLAAANAPLRLSAATLNVETLLIIVGLGMGLAILTSAIPAWYVARIKPAEVLRRA